MTPPGAPAPGAADATGGAPRLLLVDDQPANLDVLLGMLKADYRLAVATSGEAALARLARGDIELVLLDVSMPGMDGLEVCRRLRASPSTSDLPVIFLTAMTAVEDIVAGFAAGGNDYLAKPVRAEELRARLTTHLRLRAAQRKIEQDRLELTQLVHVLAHDLANHFQALGAAVEDADADPTTIPDVLIPLLRSSLPGSLALMSRVCELQSSSTKDLALAPVPLAPAVADAARLVRHAAGRKRVEVRCDIPAVAVLADAALLTNSVLLNLLTNAVKFSAAGEVVHVDAAVEGAWVRVRVMDRGIGMPPEAVDAVFDLARSKSRRGTAGERGSGFGMPLLARWVTRFGGRVEVASREAARAPVDHGTTFTIWLRAA